MNSRTRPREIPVGRPRRRVEPGLATAARLWGGLAGIGGLVHGVGELVQGNVATTSLFIASWTTGPIADNLGGEPGLTVVPSLLVSGILTVALASALIVLAVVRVAGGRFGWALIALSAGMLLVGGGVGPPAIGLCAGGAALAARRARASGGRQARSALWPWLFWLSLADILFLVFGSLIAAFVFDIDVSSAFVYAFLASVVLLPITILTGERPSTKGSST